MADKIICISSQGESVEALVDPRFGRCRYFAFANLETGSCDIVVNPNVESSGGAGIQAGQFVADKGATAVLTGNVGPNAYQTLNAAGINVYTGVSGKVKDAIEKFKNGDYGKTEGPSVGSHYGTR